MNNVKEDKCFACGRKMPSKGAPLWADTRDGQLVHVGPDCYRKVITAGETGYQPPLGGPRLYPLQVADSPSQTTTSS